mgnify:CR=1 FL=1
MVNKDSTGIAYQSLGEPILDFKYKRKGIGQQIETKENGNINGNGNGHEQMEEQTR